MRGLGCGTTVDAGGVRDVGDAGTSVVLNLVVFMGIAASDDDISGLIGEGTS